MMYTIDFDTSFYEALRRGDEAAFTTAFHRFNRMLYALAYRYLKSEAGAEDAVQYTFMRLWEQKRELHPSTNLQNLLFTILKNYLLNELRHQQIVIEKHYEMAQKQEDSEDNLMTIIEDHDFNRHLRAAICHLPEQKRRICLLKIEQGLSNQEIADRLHIALPTVKSHYTQAIKQLRGTLSKLLLILFLT